jgi:hypothetical protein
MQRAYTLKVSKECPGRDMATKKTTIRIRGFNPYYGLRPLRRVVSRDAVLVAKRIATKASKSGLTLTHPRHVGWPSRASRITSRRASLKVLSEPLVLNIVGGLAVAAIAAACRAISDHFAREREAKAMKDLPAPDRAILEFHENG